MVYSADYLLIRHLKPQAGSGICYGRLDLPAAEAPDPACDVLAARFFSRYPDAQLLSSPLQRAAQLAEYIRQRYSEQSDIKQSSSSDLALDLNWDLTLDERWQEIDFGRWEGESWNQIVKEEIDAWHQDLNGFSGHGGESAIQMQLRVSDAWDEWQQCNKGGVLICHQGVIRMVLAEVLQLPMAAQLRLEVNYQHGVWLRQSWLQDEQGNKLPDSELWQVKGLNLSCAELAQRFSDE